MYKEWSGRTMAPAKLYVHWVSAPCRAVLMTCEAAGIENEKIFVDLPKGEHKKPEFGKKNPDQTIPTMTDGDFNLWESRAVCKYLLDSRAPDHALYPKDLKKRAHIHRMLDFDQSVYKAVQSYVVPRIFRNEESSPEEMEAMFQRLNDKVFHDKSYALGEDMSLADICLIASCTFAEFPGYTISADKFPNFGAWVQRMKGSEWYKASNVQYEECKVDFLSGNPLFK